MTHWESLTEEQRQALWVEEDDLEMKAIDMGIRRFREQCNRQPMSQWPASRRLMSDSLESVVHGIEKARCDAEKGKGTRGCQGWGIPFMVMDPNVLALATLSSCLDQLSTEPDQTPMSGMINRIAQRIEMEWHFLVLKEEAPKLKRVMERRIKKWTRRSIQRARSAMGDLGDHWPAKMKRLVGAKLMEIAINHTSLFEVVLVKTRGSKRMRVIRLTPKTMQILNDTNEALEIMQPMAYPMLVPPNDWAPGIRGGYRLLSQYYPMIIHRSGSPPAPEDQGPMVYGAINALQRTAWRVNEPVLDTMLQVWHAGGSWAGLPSSQPIEIPKDYPTDGTEGEKNEWKQRVSQIHQSNARTVGKRLAFLQTLAIAEQFRSRTFYFPHRLDFRGRIYPTPQFLQPQGNDAARGLLVFATKQRLGDLGYRWLLIQYANCCGRDKLSFEERISWADSRLSGVRREDPLTMKHLWADADDPWQALATLLEILASRESGDPKSYESNLPVSVDGSNSGLQHFSAMLRDEHGAALVNLVPSEKPSDIYSDVAETVRALVEGDAKSESQPDTTIDTLPADWLRQGITRKLTKRGTMTYCYGVTQQGLKDALIADGFVNWAHNQFSAVQYIGKKIWTAIRKNITGAEKAMDWLRQCATTANKAGVLLAWETPAGFKVLHPYMDAPYARVKCLSAEIHFKVYDPDAGVIENRQRQALPPNFVHSLDASHLMMTVAAGSANGIEDWMMIHDSFGTHACNVDLLGEILREEFVKLYSVDVLEQFRQQVIEQTGEDPGPPPEQGNFNLEDVYGSTYFFA